MKKSFEEITPLRRVPAPIWGVALAAFALGLVALTTCTPQPAAASLPSPADAKLSMLALDLNFLGNFGTAEAQAGIMTKGEAGTVNSLGLDAVDQLGLAKAAMAATDQETYKKSIAKAEQDVYNLYDLLSLIAERPVPAAVEKSAA